jgi:DNA-binding MarR family transcriptional regulator
MVETVHAVDYERNASEPPLIGALLRRPFLNARAHISKQLHAAGFTDLQPAHLAVFQHPGPHGRSPGDIARGAQASKQAMNNLLAQLEHAGYLHRRIKPENRRERTVELTARGRDAVRAIRTAVENLEQRWRADLGAEHYDQLRALLERLNRIQAAE